jgi:hypothetical protein
VGPRNGHDGRKFGKGMEGFRVKKRGRSGARTQSGAVNRTAGDSGRRSEESAEGNRESNKEDGLHSTQRPIRGGRSHGEWFLGCLKGGPRRQPVQHEGLLPNLPVPCLPRLLLHRPDNFEISSVAREEGEIISHSLA